MKFRNFAEISSSGVLLRIACVGIRLYPIVCDCIRSHLLVLLFVRIANDL